MGDELVNINKKRYKVLFLASWYPSRVNRFFGIFIKKHADAVSKYCDVSVFAAILDQSMVPGKVEVLFEIEDGIPTVRSYYNPFNCRIPVFTKLFSVFAWIWAIYLGFICINKKSGSFDIVHVNVVLMMGLFALFLKYLYRIPYISLIINNISLNFIGW